MQKMLWFHLLASIQLTFEKDTVLRQSWCLGHKDNFMAPVLVLKEWRCLIWVGGKKGMITSQLSRDEEGLVLPKTMLEVRAKCCWRTSYVIVLAWLCQSWEAFGDLWKMRVLGVFGQERACWAVVGSSTEQVTVKIFDCLIAESRPGGLAWECAVAKHAPKDWVKS